MVQALTGVNDGSFTRLEVLENGVMKNVLDMLGDAYYDDSSLSQDITANAAAVAVNSASTAANTANIAVHSSTLTQHATAITSKADAVTTYSKTEVDAGLATKAGSVATLAALATKADTTTTYSKTEVDAGLAIKADAMTTYSKTEVDAGLATKAGSVATLAALATKADAVSTTSALATKADAVSTTSALATKADAVSTTAALALKADADSVYDKQDSDARYFTQSFLNGELNGRPEYNEVYVRADSDARYYSQTFLAGALNAKVDNSSVLTSVPTGALFTDETTRFWNGTAYQTSNKLWFDNAQVGLSLTGQTAGAITFTAQPAISDVVNLSSTLADKQDALTDNLTLQGGSVQLKLEADTSNSDESHCPTLIFSQDGGAVTFHIGIRELQNAAYLAWDQVGNTASSFLIVTCGGTLQTYLAQTSTGWVTTSDARLKNVIGPLEGACTKLQHINPVYFTYKDCKQRRVGLLAQEVQVILPEIVTEGPDGYLGMAYQDMVPLLLKAVNELQERVTSLEAKKKR